jgi:hypothetical protein
MICTGIWGEKKCWTLIEEWSAFNSIYFAQCKQSNLCILRLSIFHWLNIQVKLTFDHIGGKDFLCSTDNLIEIDKDTVEKVMHVGLSFI